MIRRFMPTLLLLLAASPMARATDTRPLAIDDLFALKEVGDPRLSPDGKWLAYTVSSLDAEQDKSDTDLWMVPAVGGEALRLTNSRHSEASPRWSPDGRYLAFLSSRDGEKAQVWLLNRQGGEAEKLTDFPAGVSDLAWSPDAKQLALVVSDTDPGETKGKDAEKKPKTAKPIVTRRLLFKRDGTGYLRELRSHIYLFDVQARTSVQVTSGPYDDREPAWSPDGRSIAFTSKRSKDPDLDENSDIFMVPARPGETPRALTVSPGADSAPSFSPDGKSIAYVEGSSEPGATI
jgi:Tol biopolymer transport system component